jgi:RNA polymerase sigma-70 factor, ECF subfamily
MSTPDFNALVTRYSSSLKPFALSLTRDMDEAKDLLQETIFRALASKDKYTQGTNLKGWLYTIMKNIFINNYRRGVKRHSIVSDTNNLTAFHTEGHTSRNLGEGEIVMKDINNAIERLSLDYRTPFMMHYQGFKYHEIADHLTLPLGTVKSRIHFARKELQKKLTR